MRCLCVFCVCVCVCERCLCYIGVYIFVCVCVCIYFIIFQGQKCTSELNLVVNKAVVVSCWVYNRLYIRTIAVCVIISVFLL